MALFTRGFHKYCTHLQGPILNITSRISSFSPPTASILSFSPKRNNQSPMKTGPGLSHMRASRPLSAFLPKRHGKKRKIQTSNLPQKHNSPHHQLPSISHIKTEPLPIPRPRDAPKIGVSCVLREVRVRDALPAGACLLPFSRLLNLGSQHAVPYPYCFACLLVTTSDRPCPAF